MRLLTILLLALISVILHAQEYEVPQGVIYEQDSDYSAQHDNVVAAVNYLLETSMDQIPPKRLRAQVFVLEWLTGTFTLNTPIGRDIVPFRNCTECFVMFMAAHAKHTILNEDGNEGAVNYAAVKDVMAFYDKNIDALLRCEELEEFKMLEAEGVLEAKIVAASN
ncbi:hypothetical protein [Neolewinella antarctica]|uniref:Uncharacterized protein n=1 Tax=Neolewinella antarctica TaxID=442734 RepID=A0ABX0XDF7_9BACT|nr:hypothetical protein [Neolewinella antarctica]NJC26944.1 hypothetical protein [Neolewinella antarctica]